MDSGVEGLFTSDIPPIAVKFFREIVGERPPIPPQPQQPVKEESSGGAQPKSVGRTDLLEGKSS